MPLYLLGYFRLGPKFQQAAGKGGSGLEVLELEEKVEGCPQHQDHVHGLQVGVCEIRCHLVGTKEHKAADDVQKQLLIIKNKTAQSQPNYL